MSLRRAKRNERHPTSPIWTLCWYGVGGMRVHVLHHAACFDGAASAAVFGAFYRHTIAPTAELVFVPKPHRRGDPFEDKDFEADDSAIVDFRYTTRPNLGWFFDHHKSAFQLPGEYAHFLADRSGRRFHDPLAPSCTGYMSEILRDRFGFDPSPFDDLIHWAEIIDSAAFANPSVPVELREPAMQLMTFVEHNRELRLVGRFIEDLLATPLSVLANATYVQSVVGPARDQHARDIELMRARCRVRGGVAEYDLSDQPPRAYNKFIAYYVHPDIEYLVGLSTAPDGRRRISAGYNPWLPPANRRFDIASLCERFDGGGHPYVGGVSFAPQDLDIARDAMQHIASVLRGESTLSPALP